MKMVYNCLLVLCCFTSQGNPNAFHFKMVAENSLQILQVVNTGRKYIECHPYDSCTLLTWGTRAGAELFSGAWFPKGWASPTVGERQGSLWFIPPPSPLSSPSAQSQLLLPKLPKHEMTVQRVSVHNHGPGSTNPEHILQSHTPQTPQYPSFDTAVRSKSCPNHNKIEPWKHLL